MSANLATQPPPATGPSAPIVRDEGELATGERFRPIVLAALTLALVALCLALAYPFLPAVTWGAALAIIAWPLHAWVRRRLFGHRTAAALLTSAVVVAAIVAPGAFVARELAREAADAAEQMQQDHAKGTLKSRLAATPGMAGVAGWLDRAEVDIDAEVGKAVRSYFGDGFAFAQGWLMTLLQSALALFILFYLLRDRAELLAAVRRLLPLRPAEADRVFTSAADSVYANLYASLITSVIDGVSGGLVFWALGLPAPVTWGLVMFVLSLLPVAGIFIVWVPAAVYLALIGQWGGTAALAAWGVGCSVLIDTLLYTRLAGNRMRLHPVPALLAFVGGLALFGASGMIIGPAILAVTVAVLEVWHARATNTELPPMEKSSGG